MINKNHIHKVFKQENRKELQAQLHYPFIEEISKINEIRLKQQQ